MWCNQCSRYKNNGVLCVRVPFTLHVDKNTDGKVSKEGEIMVRAEYLNMMKAKTNWYWQKNVNKQSVIISTRNIFHSCLDVSVTKYGSDIPSSI